MVYPLSSSQGQWKSDWAAAWRHGETLNGTAGLDRSRVSAREAAKLSQLLQLPGPFLCQKLIVQRQKDWPWRSSYRTLPEIHGRNDPEEAASFPRQHGHLALMFWGSGESILKHQENYAKPRSHVKSGGARHWKYHKSAGSQPSTSECGSNPHVEWWNPHNFIHTLHYKCHAIVCIHTLLLYHVISISIFTVNICQSIFVSNLPTVSLSSLLSCSPLFKSLFLFSLLLSYGILS